MERIFSPKLKEVFRSSTFKIAKPRAYWKQQENQLNFFQELASKLNIDHWEKWYDVTLEDIKKHGGGGLIQNYFNKSLYEALSNLYPSYPWNKWKFNHVSGIWGDKKVQRDFFDDLAKHLKFKRWEEWYSVTFKHIRDYGGKAILLHHHDSPSESIMACYPEYPWEIWRFHYLPKRIWMNEENEKKWFKWISEKLNIQKPEDWYSIGDDIVVAFKGATLLYKYGGMIPILQKFYPEHRWNLNEKQQLIGTKTQNWILKTLYPVFHEKSDVYVNYPHPEIRYSDTEAPMELDIFFPSLNLAFEYQGEYHYYNNMQPGVDDEKVTRTSSKDLEKKLACEKHKITLIQVPFWWNKQRESLLATIHKYRPDLELDGGKCEPIPDQFERNNRIYKL